MEYLTTWVTNYLVNRLVQRIDRDPGFPVDNPTISFWQEPPHPFADQKSEKLPNEADIVIIGSGITGVSTATHLLRLNSALKIVILDARGAISGATGRNGGHIKAVPYIDYEGLKAAHGRESAIKITKFRLAHLDAMLAEAKALGEEGKVGMVRGVESICAYYDDESWTAAKHHLVAWYKDFPKERTNWQIYESKEELEEINMPTATGCIVGVAGAAWPYRFVGCFVSKLLKTGQVSLETFTPATEICRTQSADWPFEVRTARGHIQTKHVIHCTNAHAAKLLPALKGKLWPLRGQMTVQSVPDDFPRLGNRRSWSTIWARGFDYITQSPDSDGSLYLGGGAFQGGLWKDVDVGSTEDSTQSPLCLKHLESVPNRGFGVSTGTKIEKKWTGIMGFTGDGLPIAGRVGSDVSNREDCDVDVGGEWIAAGFNGYGMVHCWSTGKALAMMVTGKDVGLSEWFPKDEFACSRSRLDKLTPEGSIRLLLEI